MWITSRLANYIGSVVLDEELKTAMRLLGAHNVRELGLHHVSILSASLRHKKILMFSLTSPTS